MSFYNVGANAVIARRVDFADALKDLLLSQDLDLVVEVIFFQKVDFNFVGRSRLWKLFSGLRNSRIACWIKKYFAYIPHCFDVCLPVHELLTVLIEHHNTEVVYSVCGILMNLLGDPQTRVATINEELMDGLIEVARWLAWPLWSRSRSSPVRTLAISTLPQQHVKLCGTLAAISKLKSKKARSSELCHTVKCLTSTTFSKWSLVFLKRFVFNLTFAVEQNESTVDEPYVSEIKPVASALLKLLESCLIALEEEPLAPLWPNLAAQPL